MKITTLLRLRGAQFLAHAFAYIAKDCAATAQRFAARAQWCATQCSQIAAPIVVGKYPAPMR